MIFVYGLLNIVAVVFALNAYGISRIQGKLPQLKNEPGVMDKAFAIAGKYGVVQKSDALLYILMPFFGVITGIAALISGNISTAAVMLITPSAVVLFLLAARKKKATAVFQKNAYKLYKYIINQSAAGVRPSDAMKKMYEVVEEKKLRRILMEACAKYSVSLDTDILSREILENIDTPEARSFAMTIRDRLFESRDRKLMERLEQLMFNRYFAYIQRDTDNLKTRCLITVVLLCSVIVVMILIPTIMDVQNALNSIFTQ